MVKRKHRQAKRAVLFVGEGTTEKAFLGYLKDLYHNRGCGTSVKIESGDGGSPDSVIKKAIGFMTYAAYEKGYVLVDDDVACPQKTLTEAGKRNIEVLWTTPCIEGFLLDILQHTGFNASTATSGKCKKLFHKHYLKENKKYLKDNYHQVFPKALLEKQRKTIPLLDDIIKVFEP